MVTLPQPLLLTVVLLASGACSKPVEPSPRPCAAEHRAAVLEARLAAMESELAVVQGQLTVAEDWIAALHAPSSAAESPQGELHLADPPGPAGTAAARGNDARGPADRMAAAMSGEARALVIGSPGEMGFRGMGSGGGGSGYGRMIVIGRSGGRRVPKLNIATGTSVGACDMGDLDKNVRARASAIRACYETWLMEYRDLAGSITVEWTVQEDGTVAKARATADNLGNHDVTDCLLRTIRRIRFAKPETGTCLVTWPFVFSPG